MKKYQRLQDLFNTALASKKISLEDIAQKSGVSMQTLLTAKNGTLHKVPLFEINKIIKNIDLTWEEFQEITFMLNHSISTKKAY